MGKDRLATFSDGVIAILITIMVLELRIPHGADMAALMGVAPSFLTYVMSFVYLAIYWNNHHHLLHTVGRVDGLILWANVRSGGESEMEWVQECVDFRMPAADDIAAAPSPASENLQ